MLRDLLPRFAVAVGAMLCVAATAAAADNLVTNGSFEQLRNDKPVGWEMSGPNTWIETDDKGNHYLAVAAKDKRFVPWAQQTIALSPKARAIKVSARMKVTGLEKGDANWKTARLSGEIRDEAGERLAYLKSLNLEEDTDWVELSSEMDVPAGATQIHLQAAQFGKAGTVSFDDVSITVTKTGDPPAPEAKADAAPAPIEGVKAEDLRPQWLNASPRELSPKRGEIDLGGRWMFKPMLKGTAEQMPDDQGWGAIPVPDTWNSTRTDVTRGDGPVWAKWMQHLREVPTAWYQRQVQVPADWAGRAVLIDFERVSTDAGVFVNGQRVGEVNWPTGAVDITDAVEPGQVATITIFVAATQDAKTFLRMMGDAPGQVFVEEAKLRQKGLIGPVTMYSRPRGAHVKHVAVEPSVRDQKVRLDVELAGVQSAGSVAVTASMLNEDGRVEKTFEKRVPVRAAEAQRLAMSWDWSDPRLWSVGEPNLYTLQLAVKGGGLDDVYATRFGFREFWIEGRDYYLNGEVFKPRTAGTGIRRDLPIAEQIEISQRLGFNLLQSWPTDLWNKRGQEYRDQDWFDAADEAGMPMTGVMPHVGWKGSNIKNDEDRAQHTAWVEAVWRRWGNHPSIVMWGSSGNATGAEKAPDVIGQSNVSRRMRESDVRERNTGETLRWFAAQIKRTDPTRPVFFHNCGHMGDVYTANFYMNFIPLQEREEWISEYVAKGDMPLWYVEFGMPHRVSTQRGRYGYSNSTSSEPLVTEHAVANLGPVGYEIEKPEYRKVIRDKFEKAQEYGSFHDNDHLELHPALQRLCGLFSRNTLRSWRTQGWVGGVIPWTDEYWYDDGSLTELGEAMMDANQPTLAWVCGGEAAGVTDKSHHFSAGAEVSKRVALLNDTLKPQAYSVSWSAAVGGEQIASGKASGDIEPGGILFEPVAFDVPDSVDGVSVDGVVTMRASIGDATHEDQFAFSAFGPASVSGKVLVADPEGQTAAMLRELGATVEGWDGKPSDQVVVIGRRHPRITEASLWDQLRAHVEAGGRAIVAAQDPEMIEAALGFRVSKHQSRYVFPVGGHPVTAGLDAADVTNWSGASTMLDPKPTYDEDDLSPYNAPYAGWRWGNRHAVSSGAVEKPHRAGWTPVLETEFDLAYSPLMELRFGKGLLVLNQLDVEDHYAQDPAAALIAARIVDYVRGAESAPRLTTIYVGGGDGAALLDVVGVNYQRAAELSSSGGERTLAILESAAGVDEQQLRSFLEAGNHVLLLPQEAESAPFGVTLKEQPDSAGATTIDNTHPVTRGLSASDVRYRTTHPAWVVDSGADQVFAGGQLAVKQVGDGLLVYSQLDPDRFNADEATYFRYTRWRQTRALAQVLANLGASFAQDGRVFEPALLQEAPEPVQVPLAGEWKIKMVKSLPGAPNPKQAHTDPGMSREAEALLAADVDDTGWTTIKTPSNFEVLGGAWADVDGEVVYRKTVEVPRELTGRPVTLSLGGVDDNDVTYVNGHRVGSTVGYDQQVEYTVPAGLLKPGENVIAVRCWDQFGGGGLNNQEELMFLGEKPVEQVYQSSPLYHPDYRSDFDLGDDPFRYYNW